MKTENVLFGIEVVANDAVPRGELWAGHMVERQEKTPCGFRTVREFTRDVKVVNLSSDGL